MERFLSGLDLRSETFTAARTVGLEQVARLEALMAALAHTNPPTTPVGKLAPRTRVERLLDPGSYFLEVGALTGLGIAGQSAGAGLIGGIGRVCGIDCMIMANDYTQKGGAVTEWGVKKTQRLAEIALENRLPSFSLIESAGADLPDQAKIFLPGGRGFFDLSRRSASRLPTICIVFGSSTAGGAYIPAMSDYVVMVQDRAHVYLAGPPLVKMATGEESSHEALGGASMHARVSGLADHIAADDEQAIEAGRAFLAAIRPKSGAELSSAAPAPAYAAEDLLALSQPAVRERVGVAEILARIVDDSRLFHFKPLYGPSLWTGFADLGGRRIGILGNEGPLFTESAEKGAQFIQLCDHNEIPLLFMQDIVGFMVGRRYEEEGIIKAGAKMIHAVSNVRVPIVTLMAGNSYGAGNYAMAGRAYNPRFVFSWPTHRIAVMGGKQLAGVMDLVKRQSAAKKGQSVDENMLAVARQMIEGQIETESDPYFATARLFDDGVIDPRDTRQVLALAFHIAGQARPHESNREPRHAWPVTRH